jgi:hypothetical protein
VPNTQASSSPRRKAMKNAKRINMAVKCWFRRLWTGKRTKNARMWTKCGVRAESAWSRRGVTLIIAIFQFWDFTSH